MTQRGAFLLACSRTCWRSVGTLGFVVVTLACGGVSSRADGDGDTDIDTDIDADNEVDGDIDADVDGGPDLEDLDDDGVPFALDCNDCNSGVGPGFTELCGNGFDEDCANGDLTCSPDDADGDGIDAAPAGTDCDDSDSSIHPGAVDRCGDGVAQNCAVDRTCTDDADGDHFNAEDDCDDTNPDVHPWAEELCDPDGVDEDCDGQVNEVSVDQDRFGCIFDSATGLWRSVDFLTDPRHCGRCRNDCIATGAGTRCSAGTCE